MGAAMRHLHGFEAAIHRERRGDGFAYTDAHGRPIADEAALERIRALRIPPAWEDVWIADDPHAHLQATGIDAQGRKQYRYHPEFRHERDALKFRDMEDFARAQPPLRRRIADALRVDGGEPLGHRRVLGLALRLLDVGLFRVGSDRYARDHRHYGLTTLLREQVQVRRRAAVFDYVGKAGKRHHVEIADPEALPVLRELRRRDGEPEELLTFRGRRGWTRAHREDVNNFLRAESGGPFSAKEYRTWNATVVAATVLAAQRPPARRAPSVAAKAASQALGNTPAVARASYIDPRVLEAYAAGDAVALDGLPDDGWAAREAVEARVLAVLVAVSRPGRASAS